MKLLVGLGNPGAKYARNRHSVGFMAVDRIAADHGFSPWRAKFDGQIAEGRLGGEKVVLLKPETFMNLSGNAVAKAVRFYKLDAPDVIVFHDEIDLAPGKIRVKDGGGHAGHNGLRSIHQHIGPHYSRVRIGVGHPGHKDRVAGYVLHDFARADDAWLEPLLEGISKGADDLARGDSARFLNAVALLVSPPRSGAPRSGVAAKTKANRPPAADPAADPAPGPEPDTRSPLQRLADRFR